MGEMTHVLNAIYALATYRLKQHLFNPKNSVPLPQILNANTPRVNNHFLIGPTKLAQKNLYPTLYYDNPGNKPPKFKKI